MLALRVKLTGKFAFITVKVAVTGKKVPGVKAGMLIITFEELPTEKFCNPVPLFIESTVTVPEPDVIASKACKPPGNRFGLSIIVKTGVQTLLGVGVAVGVGVGVGEEHCALIKTP